MLVRRRLVRLLNARACGVVRSARFFTLASLGVLGGVTTVLDGCTGDEPASVTDGLTDAGETSSSDGGGSGQNDSGTTSSEDGSSNDANTTDANDGGSEFDAGPSQWTATPPASPISTTTVGTTAIGGCSFTLVSFKTAAAPPKWDLYLLKEDTGTGCSESKGARGFGSSYVEPSARILKTTNDKHLVIAYSLKANASGSSPIALRLTQIDRRTGSDFHEGLMKTKAYMGQPVTPSLIVEQLFFADPTEEAAGTIRLKGTGPFPGATPAGTYFNATYAGFLGDVPQLPVAADGCAGSDS